MERAYCVGTLSHDAPHPSPRAFFFRAEYVGTTYAKRFLGGRGSVGQRRGEGITRQGRAPTREHTMGALRYMQI